MAYRYRRRLRLRKNKPKTKPRITKGKSMTNRALTYKVNQLTRRMANTSEVHYCSRSSTGGTIATPYASINLCRYDQLFNAVGGNGPLFGSNALDFDHVNKILHHSFTLQYKIDIANEPQNIDYTVVCISLKKKAHGLYDETTGSLSITDGPHYRLVGGMCMLNKQLFNIHYYKRMTMGNGNIALATAINGVGDQTGNKVVLNGYVKIKPRKYITNPGVIGTTGDIDTLTCDLDPTGQYYFLVFNNNISTDLQSPTIDFNEVHKFIAYS